MPFCQTDSIRLHYQIQGEGPLLTVLGGLGDSTRNWSIVASQLARDFKVLLIDNRGAGQSDRPLGPYTIAAMANDVVQLWQALGIVKTHLLGFSMGGKIAMQLAVHAPQFIDKLILVATTAASEKGPYPSSANVQTMLENFNNTEEHFHAQFEFLFSPKYRSKFEPKMFSKFKKHVPHPQAPADFLAQYAAVKDFDLTRDVQFITQPTLIITGTEDQMTDARNSEWLKDNIPHSRLELYPDVGHIPQAEDTRRFVSDVKYFLQQDDNVT